MLDLSTLPKMACMDCLRSGALVVAVTALLLGSSRSSSNRKSRDRVGLWMFGESIAMGMVGLFMLALPEVLLGHVVKGDFDVLHLFQVRMLGAAIIGCAVTSYLFIDSPNRDMWLLARLLSSMALVIAMAMAHNKPAKKLKFSQQHLTFGLLAAVLWMLGTLCVLTRIRQPGYSGVRKTGVNLSSRRDIHMLIDILFNNWEVIVCLAYPTFFFNEVNLQDFKQDHLHAHLWRVSGVFLLSLLFISTISFHTNDRLDKRAYALGRLIVYMISSLVFLCYQWWFPMFSSSMLALIWTINIGILTNLAFAIYAAP